MIGALFRLSFLCVFLLAGSTEARQVEVDLVSNFAHVSDNTLNPFTNSFEKGVLLAIENHAEVLKKKNLKIVTKRVEIGDDVKSIRESARKVVGGEAVAAIGYHSSAAALLAGPVFQENEVLLVSPTASANRVFEIGPYVISMVYSNEAEARSLARYAVEKLKAKKIRVIETSDCAYCADLSKSFVEILNAEKSVQLKKDSILESTRDLSEIAKNIASEKPDVVFVPNYELASARIIQQLLNAGFKGKFLSGDGIYNANGAHLFNVIQSQNYRAFFVGLWSRESATAENTKFLSLYRKRFSGIPDTDAALGFDSMGFLIQSLVAAKTPDRNGLQRSAQRQEEYAGASGTIRFKGGRFVSKTAPLLAIDPAKKSFDVLESITVSPETGNGTKK